MCDTNNKNIINRNIYLDIDISLNSCGQVIDYINRIIAQDDDNKESFKNNIIDFKYEPINLYINSYGGECYPALGLYDFIKNCKVDIHTYNMGACMSAAGFIFLAGKKRYGSKNSTFMFHSIRTCSDGDVTYLKDDLEECNKLQELLNNIITNNTSIKEEDLQKIITGRTQWFIRGEEALKLGIYTDLI